MARIKQVINERRIAYEKASELVKKQQNTYHNMAVMKHFEKKREADIIQNRTARKELRAKTREARMAKEAARRARELAESDDRPLRQFFGRWRGANRTAMVSEADTPKPRTASE
jgi:large subunit ribosomal protein L47